MGMKIKICGMLDEGNINEVAALKIDYMGFIFYHRSPRFVGKDFRIPDYFPDEVKKVGVFVNETPSSIKELITGLDISVLQLHGNETAEQCAKLKQDGFTVIKVFSVDEKFDFKVTTPYETVADYFLFDTKGKHYGGNATMFDWNILRKYNQRVPFFLSGGLSAENMYGIAKLKDMNIHALDVNSGVEVSPGLKSKSEIKKVIEKLNSIF